MSHTIEIVGLGGGDINQLPLGIYKKLNQLKEKIFVRTMDHPVVQQLLDEGIEFSSFDKVYTEESEFETIYRRIIESLLTEAQYRSIIYAVPGHPMLAERTVQLLQEQKEVPIKIVGGSSYLDDLFTSLKIDPIEGFQLIDATSFSRSDLNYQHHLVFCQVYDQMVASEIKLILLEDLPPEYKITIVNASGSDKELIQTISLVELDRFEEVSNLTSIYIPPVPKKMLNHTFTRLKEIIATLRGPNGCEWDRSQTHESLREYAIEEVYELIDAIDSQDDENMIEELGDVLLQVMLHSQIGEDQGYFTIDDVIYGISTKMINRHPHVFDKTTVHSIEEIHQNWDELKAKEKGNRRRSVLDNIPNSLPSLLTALNIQKEAAKVGFDWEQVEEIWQKISEELKELEEAIQMGNQAEIEIELGDILFSIVNLARRYQINPEIALNRTNQKFFSRFNYIEKALEKEGKDIKQTSLEEMDQYWEEAKKGDDLNEIG